MYWADRWMGVALVLLGCVGWVLTTRFPSGDAAVGPAFLPRVVATLLVLLGATLAFKAHVAVQTGRARRVEWQPGFPARVVASIASIVVFVVLLEAVPALGFPLLAPPLLVVLGRVFGGRRWWILVLTSIAVAEGAYFFFHSWLGLVLPPSAWF